MRPRTLWLCLGVLGALPGCRFSNDGEVHAALSMHIVSLAFQDNLYQTDTLEQQVVSDANVYVTWKGKQFTGIADSGGLLEFTDVKPSENHPADIFVVHQEDRIGVLGWTQSELVVPMFIEQRATLDATRRTTDITRILGQIRDWEVSLPGQRSELFFSYRNVQGLLPVTDVQQLDDRYANASFVAGSGEINCACIDGDNDACDGGQIICFDPQGFASGASGFTLHAPRGELEIGFVERITETETGRFVETGTLFYERSYQTGQTSDTVIDTTERIDPAFSLCPDGQEATVLLDHLGREYVVRTHGGLRVSLALRSAGGLVLPILLDEAWDQRFVGSTETGIDFSWRYPFALDNVLEDFVYDYAIAATTYRPDGTGTTYTDRIFVRRTVDDSSTMCELRIDTAVFPATFIRPTALLPLAAAAPELSWLGNVDVARQLVLSETANNRVAWRFFMPPGDILNIDLSSMPVPDSFPAPGSYEITLSFFPDIPATPTMWLDVLDGQAPGRVFSQTHPFQVE